MRRWMFGAMLWLMSSGALLAMSPTEAQAFCGFYVSGGTSDLYNEATQVVLMREGTKTVLSMRNSYKGPAKDFAMVVPVPVVLQETDVKVLQDALFERVDQLAAPRLVEYWEQDPCYKPTAKFGRRSSGSAGETKSSVTPRPSAKPKVKIEAQFDVGEYNVVILSATESNALESWLVDNKYNIPKGASEVLQSYITQGQYFFVAKVDVEKVSFDKAGRAMLSPLRFHYDSDDFQLPVRLGLLNARGAQDLIIHVLSREGRYEVANYENVFIPTNLIVADKVRKSFAAFYAALFDYTVAQHPRAVVTEYAWQANTCDPCPTPPLQDSDILTFGADVLAKESSQPAASKGKSSKPMPPRPAPSLSGWTLTRLHARYTAKELDEDLVFKQATPVIGGRGVPQGKSGTLDERGAVESSSNQFQGRYVMLNYWEGKMTCKSPERYVWGYPSGGPPSSPAGTAADTAFTKRTGVKLSSVIKKQSKNAPGLEKLK